jgi:hypothetical protein
MGRAVSVEEHADGYVLRYPAEASLFLELARWAADERRCCPFFTFGLELEPEGGDLRLRLAGSAEMKALLGEQLDQKGAAG